MSRTTRSDHKDAQLRRTAVKRYRAGIPAAQVARQLHHSRSWVYKWVHYRDQHPWTRFRSAPHASFHHPNQLSAKSERRIVRLRQLLTKHRQPRLRFASVGPRTIRKEWCRRYSEPTPSLSTIQRVLKRHHLTRTSVRCSAADSGQLADPDDTVTLTGLCAATGSPADGV